MLDSKFNFLLVFLPWSDWSSCSLTCGSGEQTRTRTCDRNCAGVQNHDLSETQDCNDVDCPGKNWCMKNVSKDPRLFLKLWSKSLFLNYFPSMKPFSWVLRIDSYQKFPKTRTKSWSKSITKLMSSEKCNFDRVKVWKLNFCRTRMTDLTLAIFCWVG